MPPSTLLPAYTYQTLTETELEELCRRPALDQETVFKKVQPILDAVKREGDPALRRFTKQFDGIAPENMLASPGDFKVRLPAHTQQAIDTAFKNIYRFHKAQMPASLEVETMPGIQCMRLPRPIEKVGLYVPGGSAVLPSTLLMLGIPAALAGCSEIVVATPPQEDGSIPDEIIYIAQKIGASSILKAGGAQAVAAMAYGTQTVPKVDKIFGPGNQYVTAAKMLLQNSSAKVAIDMPAGPSEVLVIADETAEPAFVAADLLSQAEHGADSQAILVATDEFDLEACTQELNRQLDTLPRRNIAKEALKQSFAIMVPSLKEAFSFSNRYAPEHLIVQCADAASCVDLIRHAGSVFLGRWTPESAGDYASGTNHTLPTNGYARMYSGLSVDSFLRHITVQQLSKEGLQNIGPTVEELARVEKLDAHKNAVTIRLNALKNS